MSTWHNRYNQLRIDTYIVNYALNDILYTLRQKKKKLDILHTLSILRYPDKIMMLGGILKQATFKVGESYE